MADSISVERRSKNMARIRSSDTKPEYAVRRFLHKQGLRFRLHRHSLPGRPDLVLSSRRVCVFVHGCFWHGCPRCIDGTRRVKSNTGYWSAKISGNRARDERNQRALVADGWRVLTIWECETNKPRVLERLVSAITRVRPSHRDGLTRKAGKRAR